MTQNPNHIRFLRPIAFASAFAWCGCASVPRGIHEESRQQIVALRAELLQSQNQVARLKTQNRDVVTRAVEDARRIAALESANDRLEQSVIAYQAERDEYARALKEIKLQVLASVNRPQAAVSTPGLETFIAAYPGLRHQSGPDWIALRSTDLFVNSTTDEFSPGGESLLDDLAEELGVSPASPSSKTDRDDGSVRRTSGGEATSLEDRRSIKIREQIGRSPSISVGPEWVRIDFAQGPPPTPRS